MDDLYDEMEWLRHHTDVEAATKIARLTEQLKQAERELRGAKAESERLSWWLQRIEGGDHPCDDPATLRKWAYEAITLHGEAGIWGER